MQYALFIIFLVQNSHTFVYVGWKCLISIGALYCCKTIEQNDEKKPLFTISDDKSDMLFIDLTLFNAQTNDVKILKQKSWKKRSYFEQNLKFKVVYYQL